MWPWLRTFSKVIFHKEDMVRDLSWWYNSYATMPLLWKIKNSLIVWNHPGLAWTESCSLGYDLRSSLQKKNNDREWMGNASESDNKGILRYYRHSRVSLSLWPSLTLVLIIALMDRMGSTPTNSTRWSSGVRDENFLQRDKI